MLKIDYDFINKKISSGFKLRFDIGTSTNMPNGFEWLKEDKKIFVIGIEPHPEHFTAVKNELKQSNYEDRCYLIEAAIDNVSYSTKKTFYGLDGPETGCSDKTLSGYDTGTSSLKKPKGRFTNSIKEIYNVNTISLKYILDHLDYGIIDYIKVDTQGNDLNVLKSLGCHIKNVLTIQSEYDSSGEYQNANTGYELDIFLSENNFEKYESVLCYYVDQNNNYMYDVADYKYQNTKFCK